MNSPIKWMGGKSIMRNEIIRLIPPHKTYCEPFGGAGWVLFEKPKSPVEFFNDLDTQLINLFFVMRQKLGVFLKTLGDMPISEYLFNKFVSGQERYTDVVHGDKLHIPDVVQACKTYYIIMSCFNGNISNTPSFAISPNKRPGMTRFNSTDWDRIRARLKSVTILNRDFSEVIERTDSPTSFFYLDPPYIVATDTTRYYRYTFAINDHERLRDCLKSVNGKFLLSYGDDPQIKNLYSDFNVVKSMTNENELLIMNYEPDEGSFYPGVYGIPEGSRAANWKYGNCPLCGSRNIKKLYERVTLDDKKRSFISTDFKCGECLKLWNGPGV